MARIRLATIPTSDVPPIGQVSIYAKANLKLYLRDETGAEYELLTSASPLTVTQAPRVVDLFGTGMSTQVRDIVKVLSDGSVQTISNNLASSIPYGIFGIVYTKPSTTTCEVITAGMISGFSGLTPGAPVWVSETGGLTQTPPLTGVLQQIGVSITPTSIFVQLQQAIARS